MTKMQFSVSHDPSESFPIGRFTAQEIFIIYDENGSAV